MMIEVKEVDPHGIEWDSQVKSIPEGTIYQTTYWARYLESYPGAKPIFLIAQDEKGNILGSLFLYRTRYFKRLLRYGILGKMIFKLINWLLPAATWNYGPLIYEKSNFDEVFAYFIKEALRIMKKEGIFFLKDATLPIHTDEVYLKRAEKILPDFRFKSRELATIFLDFKKSADGLWNGLKNSARKAIMKNNNLDLTILSMRREDIGAYHELLLESRKRSGIELPPVYPGEIMWDELGQDRQFLQILSVNKGSKLLGAIGILSFNGIIFETGPAQSDYAFENKIYVNDILKWEIIEKGKDMNARLYDLCGIFLYPKKDKEKSLNRFKEKWGGRIVRYKSYSKIFYKI